MYAPAYSAHQLLHSLCQRSARDGGKRTSSVTAIQRSTSQRGTLLFVQASAGPRRSSSSILTSESLTPLRRGVPSQIACPQLPQAVALLLLGVQRPAISRPCPLICVPPSFRPWSSQCTRALAQYQSPDMDFKFGAGLSVDYVKPDGEHRPRPVMLRPAVTAAAHKSNALQSCQERCQQRRRSRCAEALLGCSVVRVLLNR